MGANPDATNRLELIVSDFRNAYEFASALHTVTKREPRSSSTRENRTSTLLFRTASKYGRYVESLGEPHGGIRRHPPGLKMIRLIHGGVAFMLEEATSVRRSLEAMRLPEAKEKFKAAFWV